MMDITNKWFLTLLLNTLQLPCEIYDIENKIKEDELDGFKDNDSVYFKYCNENNITTSKHVDENVLGIFNHYKNDESIYYTFLYRILPLFASSLHTMSSSSLLNISLKTTKIAMNDKENCNGFSIVTLFEMIDNHLNVMNNDDIVYNVNCYLSVIDSDNLGMNCDVNITKSEMIKYNKDLTDTAMVVFILYMIDEGCLSIGNFFYDIDNYDGNTKDEKMANFLLSKECILTNDIGLELKPHIVESDSYYADEKLDFERFLDC